MERMICSLVVSSLSSLPSSSPSTMSASCSERSRCALSPSDLLVASSSVTIRIAVARVARRTVVSATPFGRWGSPISAIAWQAISQARSGSSSATASARRTASFVRSSGVAVWSPKRSMRSSAL